MKRNRRQSNNDDDKSEDGPIRKKIKLIMDDTDNGAAPIDTSKTIITTITGTDARSIRSIRRAQGFEDQTSILGAIEKGTKGDVLVTGEEATGDAERMTVDNDGVGTILFEPFTLERERQEGDFDEEGNYVEEKRVKLQKRERLLKSKKHDIDEVVKFDKRNRNQKNRRQDQEEQSDEESDGEKDAWLEELEDQEKAYFMKQSNAPRKMKSKVKSESKPAMDQQTKLYQIAQNCDTIINLIEDEEAPQEALTRLRASDEPSFHKLNNACSKLLSLTSDYEMYTAKKDHFEEMAKVYDYSEFGKWYEYKWQSATDGEIYGPFSGRQMKSWKDHFIQHPILIRSISKQEAIEKLKKAKQTTSADEDDMFAEDDEDKQKTVCSSNNTSQVGEFTAVTADMELM